MALRQPFERGLGRRIFGVTPQGTLALLRGAWARAVGPDLAGRTEVLAIEGQTLRIRVPDARWRKVLHGMRREILSRLRNETGDMAPFRLGFQEGSVMPTGTPPAPAPRVAEVAPLPGSVAAEAEAIVDPEIRAQFEGAAARYMGRFRCHEARGRSPHSTVPSPYVGRDRVGGR